MIIIGGKQGWLSFLGLLLNFIYFYISLVLVALHAEPLIVTVIMGLLILATTIFIGTEDLQISLSAFEAAVVVMVLIIVVTQVMEHFVQATGFSTENSSELEGMSILIGINYVKLGVMTTILSCLGAVAEAAIAIASGVSEITHQSDSIIASAELRQSGREIGQQIISTTLNTLLMGFLGNLMALLIWFVGLNYSLATIINNKILVAEVVTVLISFIGVIVTVPLTTEFVIWNYQNGVDNRW